MKKFAKAVPSLGFLLLVAMFVGGCATNAVTGKQDLMLVSGEDEATLANEEHKRFLQSPGLYSDQELQNYVQQIGEKIVAASDRSDIGYQFFVLDQPEVNAFALPDGHIYVTRGLLSYLGSEAELAAVLAHEVAHVTARHSAQLMSSAKVAGAVSTVLGVIAGAAVGAATGDVNLAMSTMDAASGVSALAGVVVIGNYSREHELEADQFGMRYLTLAGYPKQAMAGVFDSLKSIEKFNETRSKKEEKRHLYHQIATHPELDERLEKAGVEDDAAQEQNATALQTAYLERTAGLIFETFDEVATDKRRDVWLNREALFQIYLPTDWEIVESSKDTVVLDRPEDKVRNTFRLLPPQADHDPTVFFSGEPVGAKAIREIWDLNHVYYKDPATPGFSALAEIETADGTRPIYVAVLFHEKYTILMTGMPDDPEWLEKRRYVFEAQANMTKLVTQEEYDRTRVKRIQFVKARAGDTYAALAEEVALGETGESYLRLLNRQYPEGEPVAAQAIRVVVPDP